ncbi:unnamed protein product [Cuscuta epithymum]|uniref:CRM domain-containing protein n=1 Tax=Cuscuta epithymum TaxID=186058 RepID=A0AAV0FLC8_9ASTE|nr:unnamed protein product [Cuscuta epithymum]
MLASSRNSYRQCSKSMVYISKICRSSLLCSTILAEGNLTLLSSERKTLFASSISPESNSLLFQRSFASHQKLRSDAIRSDVSIELKADRDVVRFSVGQEMQDGSLRKAKKVARKIKMSKRAKVNELRFYRLKAKKKMTSPNPEVRIRYKLDKAKRKEVWLIEKLRNFEVPKAPIEPQDPEILTEEDRFYLKRTGEKKKNYVPVGRRGVFGGVVLNMHLHWKNHETVKVVCKPCKPGQVHEYAVELARLSGGIVIDIKPDNTIIFYRGKNYVRPDVLSPPDTLSKAKALEKYKLGQSLDHTSQFIEKLEKELEDYHEYLAQKKERYALMNLNVNV